MQVRTFTATTAAEALEQIRAALGPQAVVLHVRQANDAGLARFWKRSRIEIVAGVPAPESEPVEPAPPAWAELQEEIREIKRALASSPGAPMREGGSSHGPANGVSSLGGSAGWRSAGLLLDAGFQPVHVESLLDRVRAQHGGEAPDRLGDELRIVREALSAAWPGAGATDEEAGATHVLVGAPGVGKSTLLCKWLARATLVEGRTAVVSRWDAHVANMAEGVSLYAEILGVPVMRGGGEVEASAVAADLHLIDLPGVVWTDAAALEAHLGVVRALSGARIHLVLNAAYDARVLEAQVRAFATLPIASLMFTHADEVRRWGGVWNVVLGTKYPVRFVSGGQNVPGDIEQPAGRLMADRVISLPATH